MPYRQLDLGKIILTIETLRGRIAERFPESGLSKVCEEMLRVSQNVAARCEEITKPILGIRLVTYVLASLVLAAPVLVFIYLSTPSTTPDMWQFIQVLEAGSNELVLWGAALFFLVTYESRIKRGKALAALHELRSLAHVIDMHQLTKDPQRRTPPSDEQRTPAQRSMSVFDLGHYLDFCSEMLSMVSKLAAVYSQHVTDSVVLEAVVEVEGLCSSLSNKIWQKIMILETGRS